jgi:hypothetical protein
VRGLGERAGRNWRIRQLPHIVRQNYQALLLGFQELLPLRFSSIFTNASFIVLRVDERVTYDVLSLRLNLKVQSP